MALSLLPSLSVSLSLLVSQCFPPSLCLFQFLYLPLSHSFCFSLIYVCISSFTLTLPLAYFTTAILASWLFFKRSKFFPISKPPDARPACLLTSFQSLLKCQLFTEACSGLQTLSLLILFVS